MEYELHGEPLLAVVIEEQKNSWILLNEQGKTVELASQRLFLYPDEPLKDSDKPEALIKELRKRTDSADQLISDETFEKLWDKLKGQNSTLSVEKICQHLFGKQTSSKHLLACRRKLLKDTVFFKRKKNGFEARSPYSVEELKRRAEEDKLQRKEREKLKLALLEMLKNPGQEPPASIEGIEQLAALGSKAENSKNSMQVVDDVIREAGLEMKGKADERAFRLLVAIKHFSEDENLHLHRSQRTVRFSSEIEAEATKLKQAILETPRNDPMVSEDLYAITIDSADTQDVDDAITLRQIDQGFELGIHISNVAEVFSESSIVGVEAFRRATSIYCPDLHIPMLPRSLSEDALSLHPKQTKSVLSYYIEFNDQKQIIARRIEPSTINVKRRLSYEEVDEILYAPESVTGSDLNNLESLLFELWNIAGHLESKRLEAGAVRFLRREKVPLLEADHTISLGEAGETLPSRKLIEEFMILANETAALYAAEQGFPLVFRIQEAPDNVIGETDQKVPEGPAKEYQLRGQLKRSETSDFSRLTLCAGTTCLCTHDFSNSARC